MRIANLVVITWAFAVLAACDVPHSSGLKKQDIEAIEATQNKYVNAVLASDWNTWTTTLAPDAVFMPPEQAPLKGRDAIVVWAKTLPKTVAFKLSENEIAGAGDLAYATGTYVLTSELANGSKVEVHGVRAEIHRRQSDGSWLYSRAMFHPTAAMTASSSTPSSADEAAVRALIATSEAATNQRNFAALASLFTVDGDLIVFDQRLVSGRDSVQRTFGEAWKGQPTSCRIALGVDGVRFLNLDTALIEDSARFTGCKGAPSDRATFVISRRNGNWQIAAMRIFSAAK